MEKLVYLIDIVQEKKIVYIKPFEIEGKKIKDIDNEEWFLIYTVNIDTLKVIGNIYDNPELSGGE